MLRVYCMQSNAPQNAVYVADYVGNRERKCWNANEMQRPATALAVLR